MTNKFQVGDFVWCDFTDRLATIVAYHEKQDCYELNDGVMADEDDLELLDKEKVRDNFLNELQCLLTTYNAKIGIPLLDYDTLGFPDVNVEITLGEAESQINICYPCMKEKFITPENIFDYDKGEQPLP